MTTPSRMEELQEQGLSAVRDDDWAAEGQKCVIEGSDGLWCRFGSPADGSIKANFCAFQFNPCVSFCALVLLFALVGLCSIPPGEYCSQQKMTWLWTNANTGTKYAVQERKRQVGDPAPPTDGKLMENAGGGGAAVAAKLDTPAAGDILYYTYSTTAKAWVPEGSSFVYSTEVRVEKMDCFMPKKEFQGWMVWTTEQFTWLYIITQDIWIFFLAVVAYKYGKIKLGRDDDAPEFSNFGFFAMLFTCGVATGLFFFAVTEPQYYYLVSKTFNGGGEVGSNGGYYERNRWTYNGVTYVNEGGKDVERAVWNTPNVRAQEAMTTTFYHWGLHGWVCYCIVALILGFMHFRKGLPMTIKTCFYPLVGTRIYGFMGDFVDTISVVATTMGVCTSLGMGVMQLNSGIEYLRGGWHFFGENFYNKYNYDDWKGNLDDLKGYWDSWPKDSRADWYDPDSGDVIISTAAHVADTVVENDQQMFLIIIVSVCAIGSVLLGLKNGIKNLAILCLIMGQFVIFYVWMMDDTWFLTNLFIQSIGDYIQKLPAIGFYASAVEQSELNNSYGEYASWQRWWTIFYWGWWIAWCPFVGVFIARLGRGRTVREFIFSTMIAAVLYNMLFLTVLGGAGLKMQMLAEKHGVGAKGCKWNNEVYGEGTDLYRQHPYKANICRPVTTGKYSTEAEMFCSTVTNLACSLAADGSMPLFDVVGQYGEMSRFMVGFTLFSLSIYFIASSDSGSMTDDMICANGMPEPNLIQRLLWASTECIAACSLMSVGKYVGSVDGALRALRAISIVVGIPYTFICCFMMLAIWRAFQYETGERVWGTGFSTSVVDIGIQWYTCKPSRGQASPVCCNCGAGKFNVPMIINTLVAGFFPIVPLLKVAGKIDAAQNRKMVNRVGAVGAFLFFFTAWILILADYADVVDGPEEWGEINGDKLNGVKAISDPGANFRYYVSNRYGFYKQWENENVEYGDAIKWNTKGNKVYPNDHPDVDKRGKTWNPDMQKANEVANSATVNGKTVPVGVGPATAKSRRIATIGWFMLLCIYFLFITQLRGDLRAMYNIPGNLFEDYMCAWFWPGCLRQMAEQCDRDVEMKAAQQPPKAYEPAPAQQMPPVVQTNTPQAATGVESDMI